MWEVCFFYILTNSGVWRMYCVGRGILLCFGKGVCMKNIVLCLFLVFLALPLAAQRPAEKGVVDDWAGSPGKNGFFGDGDDALKARFASPTGLAVNRWGDLYIADTLNHRIRRVDGRNGRVETVAGNGKAGYFNDGGPAENVTLNNPSGIALDRFGNLFIADTGNNRIRMLTLKGNLITVAGTGRRGFNGDKSVPMSTDLNAPTALAFNSKGELYISDTGNNRIRKIDLTTGRIETVAGTGAAGMRGDVGLAANAELNAPTAILFDDKDNLFIADTRNHKVRLVTARKNMMLTLAGTGLEGFDGDNSRKSADSRFDDPTGLALDGQGRLYVSDTDNQRIRRITIKNIDGALESMVETVAGNGTRGYNGEGRNPWETTMAYPGALIITPYDALYFLDTGNNLVRRVRGISSVTAPVTYNAYGKPAQPKEQRNFFDVLFGWTKK